MSDMPAAARRPRVLLSAFACGPGDEPEAGAGWGFARAAAQHHEVWVITRTRFEPAVRRDLDANPDMARNLHVHFLDLSERAIANVRRGWDVYWYYALWQRRCAKLARSLHESVGFDLVHHVTWANDWLPCGARSLAEELPAVWGPVGGATRIPIWRLRRWLGPRGAANEYLRAVATWLPRRIWGDGMARRSALVVAQNRDVAHRFRAARRVVVEPNPALEGLPPREDRPAGTQRTAVFVGRLIGLKCPRLAIAAIARDDLSNWRLEIFGDGYERRHLEEMVVALGVQDRVVFHGHKPRSDVLEAYRSADALLFPSVHDQAGWAVAEASSMGVPVVCLPLGGPPVLADSNGFVADLRGDLVANVAAQLSLAGESGGTPHVRWSVDRLPALVDDWYADALASRGARST